jgi:hypothetical protein
MAGMETTTAQQLADRYAQVWNEPDPATRRTMVADLWAPDAVHLLQPPQEIRDRAAALGFPDPALEARGLPALETRVRTTYEELVAPGTMVFRAHPDAQRLADAVTFRWAALHPETEEVLGGGLEFVILDESGRITRDYQFITG